MDKDIDILINPKSLALFISKILSKNKGLSLTCRNGSDETLEQYESFDIGLRVFLGKKNIILSTNDTT